MKAGAQAPKQQRGKDEKENNNGRL